MHTYSDRLIVHSDKVVWITGEGGAHTFDGAGPSYATSERLGTLVKNGNGTFTYTERDNTVYSFDVNGRLVNLADRHGNELNIHIDSTGNIKRIDDPDNVALHPPGVRSHPRKRPPVPHQRSARFHGAACGNTAT